jgi:hypothetical protein
MRVVRKEIAILCAGKMIISCLSKHPLKTKHMKRPSVAPKRTDFGSFDDYFHAMIQYQLELSQQHWQDVTNLLLPEERITWIQRLQGFIQAHQQ